MTLFPPMFPNGHPLSNYTGQSIRVGIIDSGVNPAHPHVCGVAGGVRISSGDAEEAGDYLDYIGHGTAVAGAIREKVPEALLFAVKVFDRALTTNIEAIVKAINWCRRNGIDVINLSLGTINNDHRGVIEECVTNAADKGSIVVAAREMSGQLSLPGCLPSVIGVEADWELNRDTYAFRRANDDVVFLASAFPRDIPGVSRERNLKGISFAVANMTGFVARARECSPDASIAAIKELLIDSVKLNEAT